MITLNIEDRDGGKRQVEAPTDMNLSLMELLKASEYEVMATCGGMALCATCHVHIEDQSALNQAEDMELDMLDTLPDADDTSRLSCQIRLEERMDGLEVRLHQSDS
jgi:ferredoxin